ncbi:MFS transporter [Bailinhaonella thermotolerans]|uniref:MFS transporter n=1 Tax=Bailinhaonella thermotolerans TaxID=1070861 RepID=A0A3A4A8L0_9ACTN|nr:MFS transporter [Bailinhaonella thermotolerans]RJL23267.1 MFS transporter [Bailinhaonella thermotolerans]
MTTSSPPPAEPGASVIDGTMEGKTPIRGPLRRLLAWVLPANMSIYLVWGAVPSVLMALQVQRSLGEEDKAANLAIITTVGAIASVLTQPIAGAISDRTRSRFGRRAPWLIFGGLVGGLSLIGMSLAHTLAHFVIAWVCVQIGFNFAQGPLSAVLPDRVPRSVRGTFAAALGLGAMFGSLGGQIYGASLSDHIPLAYTLLAGIGVLGLVLFVVFNPDRSGADEQVKSLTPREFLRAFWVSPRKYPDFAWAFGSRLSLYLGYHIVVGYKLYILQDYIGLGADAITVLPAMGAAALGGLLVTTVIGGRLSDHLGRRKIFVLVSAAVVGGAMLIPLALPSTTGILLMAGVAGLGFGCFQAVDTALISEVLPSKASFAKDLGIVNMAQSLPQVLAPAMAGAIVIASGGYAALFPVGAVFGVLGGLAVLPVKAVR